MAYMFYKQAALLKQSTFFPFGKNETAGLSDIFFVFQHEFSGKSAEAVQRPGNLLFFHCF